MPAASTGFPRRCYNPHPNKKIILICLKPADEVRDLRAAAGSAKAQHLAAATVSGLLCSWPAHAAKRRLFSVSPGRPLAAVPTQPRLQAMSRVTKAQAALRLAHTTAGCCAQGGESLMGDSAAIAAAMPEFVLQRFQDRGGVLYTRRYVSAAAAKARGDDGPPALTWQDRTGFSDPAAAAGFFKDLGFKVECQEGDTLVATHVAPPVVPHPVTGQPVW